MKRKYAFYTQADVEEMFKIHSLDVSKANKMNDGIIGAYEPPTTSSVEIFEAYEDFKSTLGF